MDSQLSDFYREAYAKEDSARYAHERYFGSPPRSTMRATAFQPADGLGALAAELRSIREDQANLAALVQECLARTKGDYRDATAAVRPRTAPRSATPKRTRPPTASVAVGPGDYYVESARSSSVGRRGPAYSFGSSPRRIHDALHASAARGVEAPQFRPVGAQAPPAPAYAYAAPEPDAEYGFVAEEPRPWDEAEAVEEYPPRRRVSFGGGEPAPVRAALGHRTSATQTAGAAQAARATQTAGAAQAVRATQTAGPAQAPAVSRPRPVAPPPAAAPAVAAAPPLEASAAGRWSQSASRRAVATSELASLYGSLGPRDMAVLERIENAARGHGAAARTAVHGPPDLEPNAFAASGAGHWHRDPLRWFPKVVYPARREDCPVCRALEAQSTPITAEERAAAQPGLFY